MSPTLAVMFLMALLVAVVTTPLARRLALRVGVIDQPSARNIHSTPVPLLGGLGIFAGVAAAMVFYGERTEITQLAGIMAGATWMSLWGVWDDHSGLRASTKVMIQTVASVVLVAAGVQVQLPIPTLGNVLLTVFWVLVITNSFNLIDNMDGLSGGIGSVAAAVFMVLAALNGQYLVGSLAAALLGSCLGFLLFNFNPARIFMGDSGSLFLGFVMAALAIKMRFPESTNRITWMVPILILGVPIFDTALVIGSRLRRGCNPFTTPGRDHLSHRLVALGLSCRKVVLLLYLVSILLGGVAVFVSVASFSAAYLISGVVAVAALAAVPWLERIEVPMKGDS